MSKKKWILSPHCTGFVHCASCRDNGPRGIEFRQQRIDDGYEVPGGIRDFECPWGAKWGHGQPRGLGEVMAKIAKWMRIKECGGCRKRRGWLNRLTSRP